MRKVPLGSIQTATGRKHWQKGDRVAEETRKVPREGNIREDGLSVTEEN